LAADTRFYFVHSYAAQSWEGDPGALLSWATHHVRFLAAVESLVGHRPERGVFAADMKVALVNDGPVTIVIDSRRRE
jgi:hypothetical protein